MQSDWITEFVDTLAEMPEHNLDVMYRNWKQHKAAVDVIYGLIRAERISRAGATQLTLEID